MTASTPSADESAARHGSGFTVAVAMFTALPVPGGADLHIDRRVAARALRWLPVVGGGLGLLAGIVLVVTNALAPGTTGALLGSALAVGGLALATRGLHLDGLADTVDGLGSAAGPERALAIMRKPDIGPFGVVAVVLVLLVKVCALAAATGRGYTVAVFALILSEYVGRAGVVLAAGHGVPSARSDGFGALVAGTASTSVQVLVVAGAVGIAAFPLGWAAQRTAVQLLVAALVGLGVAIAWRRHVVRRIGGVTGDVFGSVVELASAATVLAVALTG